MSDTHTLTHTRTAARFCYGELTFNCICRTAARFCYAVLLSWGQKSHGTNAVAKSSRRYRIGGPEVAAADRAARALARSGGFAAPCFSRGTENPTAPTTSPRPRARYRIGGPEITRDDARGHAPRGRANGLYVVVVGEGVCRPFLRGRSKQPSIPQIRLPQEAL